MCAWVYVSFFSDHECVFRCVYLFIRQFVSLFGFIYLFMS